MATSTGASGLDVGYRPFDPRESSAEACSLLGPVAWGGASDFQSGRDILSRHQIPHQRHVHGQANECDGRFGATASRRTSARVRCRNRMLRPLWGAASAPESVSRLGNRMRRSLWRYGVEPDISSGSMPQQNVAATLIGLSPVWNPHPSRKTQSTSRRRACDPDHLPDHRRRTRRTGGRIGAFDAELSLFTLHPSAHLFRCADASRHRHLPEV